MKDSERTGVDLFFTSLGAVIKLAMIIIIWTVLILSLIPRIIFSVKD